MCCAVVQHWFCNVGHMVNGATLYHPMHINMVLGCRQCITFFLILWHVMPSLFNGPSHSRAKPDALWCNSYLVPWRLGPQKRWTHRTLKWFDAALTEGQPYILLYHRVLCWGQRQEVVIMEVWFTQSQGRAVWPGHLLASHFRATTLMGEPSFMWEKHGHPVEPAVGYTHFPHQPPPYNYILMSSTSWHAITGEGTRAMQCILGFLL